MEFGATLHVLKNHSVDTGYMLPNVFGSQSSHLLSGNNTIMSLIGLWDGNNAICYLDSHCEDWIG